MRCDGVRLRSTCVRAQQSMSSKQQQAPRSVRIVFRDIILGLRNTFLAYPAAVPG